MHRYHPEDPRSSAEGYEGSLTQDEEDALNELQAITERDDLDLRLVRGDYGEGFDGGQHAVEPLRLCLLRFLRGNAFSVGKALSQLEDCVDHRRQHPTDKLLSKSPREVLGCNVEEFNSFYPRWLMGYDRLGRPILATRYGSLRLWEMTKLTTVERMTELHAREQELLLRVLRRRTLEGGGGRSGGDEGEQGGSGWEEQGGGVVVGKGHIVDTAVVVIDTAGLTLRHVTKAFVRLFKMRAHMDQLLFPEMLGKCFIVNTPSLFSYVWAMFSPMVDERTRSKDWQKALQEIVDPAQLSPEYGGTGPRQEELPSLADALFAAGNRGGGGSRSAAAVSATQTLPTPVAPTPTLDTASRARAAPAPAPAPAGTAATLAPAPSEAATEKGATASEVDTGVFVKPRVAPYLLVTPEGKLEDQREDEEAASKGAGRGGWPEDSSNTTSAAVPATWGPLGWFWNTWWGGAQGSGVRDDVEGSVATSDEEFFDALAELDQSNTYRGGATRRRNRSSRLRRRSGSDIEAGRLFTSSENSRNTRPPPGNGAGPAVAGIGGGQASAEAGGDGGAAEDEGVARPLVFVLLGRCYAPVLRRLNRKCVDQLARWLCYANAASATLAVAVIVTGAFSLSRAKVLGLQWCAVTAVCLGSLLLLLALIGTAGARLRNRFTLLGFAALEAAVALGMLLSGIWCLALAGGSATLSDLTWEAMHHERDMSGTKEDFLDGAQNRLLSLGASGLVLALFSVVGPCLLSSVLLGKIRNMEEERARRDDERRFRQIRRCFQEANALCSIFACVCAGYGGYALSFTVALGLGANVASTYLLVASSYLLLLAGAVGFWATRSGRPDAFRIHSAALVPAGAVYASLSVVQVVAVGPSDGLVADGWEDLRADGENLYSIQASVSTMLIVGGVLSAVTFALVVCAAVASRAARLALLHLPETSTHRRRNLRKAGKLTRGEKLVIAWALALATTSTFIDGSFAVFSAWLARDGGTGGTWMVSAWRAMGRGDRRYVEGDTFTVATATIVALVQGPTAVLYAWAVYTRRGFRFSVGILVCTASLHTQLLRYVTSAESSSSESESGSKAFYMAVSVLLALLQVAGALAVLIFNVRKLTKRVNAAELLLHARLGGKIESIGGDIDGNCDFGGGITGNGGEDVSGGGERGRRR